jgi:hypothetical protein
MTMQAIPTAEFDLEMVSTRKLLARVPSEKGTWKPHVKSFPLAHLAQLVAGIPSWITRTLRETELDLSKSAGYSTLPTPELLTTFDKNVKDARAALESVTDSALDVPWSLKMGDRVLFTTPRRGHSSAPEPSHSPSRSAHRLPAAHRCSAPVHLRTDRR